MAEIEITAEALAEALKDRPDLMDFMKYGYKISPQQQEDFYRLAVRYGRILVE